jgi:hypothetical protein
MSPGRAGAMRNILAVASDWPGLNIAKYHAGKNKTVSMAMFRDEVPFAVALPGAPPLRRVLVHRRRGLTRPSTLDFPADKEAKLLSANAPIRQLAIPAKSHSLRVLQILRDRWPCQCWRALFTGFNSPGVMCTEGE